MNPVSTERRHFLASLRKDPSFLASHSGFIVAAAFRKLRNGLRSKLSTKHRGLKHRPSWLSRKLEESPGAWSSMALLSLPSYCVGARKHEVDSPAECGLGVADAARDVRDPEDYLSRHRFGFLKLWDGGDDSAHSRLLEAAERWISANRNKEDEAWEPYSTCERVSNLVVFLAVTGVDCSPEKVAPFLDESMVWIYRHLEYYGSTGTNNHIINNARALALAGVALQNDSAVSIAMEIFRRYLPQFIGEGGFLRERSSHYQLVVLNWVLDAWHFIAYRRGSESADAEYLLAWSTRMAGAACLVCQHDRLLVTVGDISPDSTPRQCLERLRLLYPDQWPGDEPQLKVVETRDGWFRVSGRDDVIVGNFPSGRYPFPYPTHGHCDLTSFVWLHRGHEVLADPGRYRYTSDDISLFQRSASGHNVPLINGFAPLAETIVVNRQWWPTPYARAELRLAAQDQSVALSHDGFSRGTPVSHHTRSIALADSSVVVTDTFDGMGKADASLCWHFGRMFHGFDEAEMTAKGSIFDVHIAVDGTTDAPSVDPASGAAPGSWSSKAYGDINAALGIRLSLRLSLPATVITRFTVRRCAA